MAETTNLKLYTTPADDVTTTLKDWVQNIAGESESNMTKIDDAYKSLVDARRSTDAVVQSLNSSIASVQTKVGEHDTQIADLQSADEAAATALSETNDAVAAIETRTASLATDIQDLDVSVQTLNEDVQSLEESKQDTLTFDYEPVLGSNNVLTSGAVESALSNLDAELRTYVDNKEVDPGISFDAMEYDEEHYLHILLNGEDVVDPVYIQGGSGGGTATGAIMKLVNTSGSTSLPVASGYDCKVTYRFSSVDDADSTPTGDGTATYALDDTVILSTQIVQGDHEYTVSKDLLSEGNHTLVLHVIDAYGTERKLTWTIVVKAIAMSTNIDDTIINYGSLLIRYTPIGSGISKTTHFELDGEIIKEEVTTDSNIPKSLTLGAQSHGAHDLRVWTSATIGGVEVSSTVLEYSLIWVEENNMTPIVSIKSFATPTQYSTTEIPYMVYDPRNATATVVTSEDGVDLPTLNVDRGVQKWYYTPQTTGEHVLKITCDTVSDSVTVNVASSGVTITEITDGLLWKFDPTGRSNAETDRAVWSDGDVEMIVPDTFRWNRGGWGTDDEGYPCFTVPAGSYVQFSAKLFSNDWKRNGHNFKIVYKTANVANYDAQVLTCMNDGIGLTVNAQSATICTQQTNSTIPLCEDYYTELEFNVTSLSSHTEIVTWVQGIPSKVVTYGTGDGFIQSEVAPITIGSNDCDVHIYRMREYEAYLTNEEIFANWIADSPSGEEMLERDKRNKITDGSGNIDPDELAKTCPGLRVITLKCPRFTTSKKDPVAGCEVRHVMVSGGKKHCWTSKDVIHCGQGTSSDNYGESSRNLDFDLSAYGFDLDDGTHVDTYAMTDNSIGVNYFNLKVNVASSENANNAYLTKEFQRFNPYLRDARKNDSRVRDTMEFWPCAIFVQDESGELFGDTNLHFYSAGDMGNSKKNFEAQGLDSSNPNECIVELKNNTDDINRWKSDALDDAIWDEEEVVEFRFPKSPTTNMRRSFERVLSWVVSTDTTQATNVSLDAAVTYGDVTYTIDNIEYRKAKFINEFDDYFVSDSIMFHYLFTDRHTMVDNRAKNTFWHTSDGILWDLCFNYDDDTSMGIDNVGGMTLTYGLEDTDKLGDRDVFNAADSVVFCNVRDLLPDRLRDMFQQMESLGAWDAKRLLSEMDAYQAIKPERLWIADMQRKYLRPWEDNGTTSYLEMLNGKKTLQRAQFELYQEYYCASKYRSSKCTSNKITLRTYKQPEAGETTQTVSLDITMYSDCYIVVQFGSMMEQVRVKRGVPTTVNHVVSMLNDTETYICTASRIQAIGDLSAVKVGFTEFTDAEKLQSLVISPYSEDYINTNLNNISLNNCKILKNLEVCGCPNLIGELNFESCPRLETLDLRNTGVSGVTFANGGYLRTAELPASITGIVAKSLNDLEVLNIAGYDNLRRLQIEYCTSLDSLGLVNKSANLNRVRLIDINWRAETSDVFMRLSAMAGIDDSGLDISTSVVNGYAYVGSIAPSRLNKLGAIYPNLVIEYSALAPEYTVRFLNYDNSVLDSQVIEHGSGAEDPLTRRDKPIAIPVQPSSTYYNYTFTGWSGTFDAIVQNTDIIALYDSSTRTYTVQWMNGIDLLQEDTVDAGGSSSYTGDVLNRTGYIWMGFDGDADEVLSDLVISAVFVPWELPSAIVDSTTYDYIYSDDETDNSGYTFPQFAGIIESGKAAEYFPEYGLIKVVNTGSAVKDASIVFSLHSTGHFELGDGSGLAKTTWATIGTLNEARSMNSIATNAGGYLESEMDDWIENTLYPSLPYHWLSVIKPVIVYANIGNQSSDIASGIRHAYIPASAELGFETTAVPYKNEVAPTANEIQFSMYTSNTQRIKKTFNGEGTAVQYWTRSANPGDAVEFNAVSTAGYSYGMQASYSYYICLLISV